jgi:16S rRNA (cytidine1402-2'-O)-methyltransferase
MPGVLHVVATPIGNLGDAAPRVAETLRECAIVLCEDTRRTRHLCVSLGVETKLVRCDEHVEERRVAEVLELLRQGRDVALVSDAGTPAINDPGYRLVAAVHAAGLTVSPVPGPSAVTAALSISGLPTDAFIYEGFPPRKRAARRRFLAALADEPRTIVLLESPHRLAETLGELAELFGSDRPAFLGRELTKLHEECVRATLGELRSRFGEARVRGEVVLVVSGAPATRGDAASVDLVAEVARLVAAGLDERDALRQVAKAHGLGKRDVYRIVKLGARADDDSEE